nr:PREDICTED: katanin p80 WD40 repeat-containing subunit B1 homolog isoform X2 [Nicotiana tabacum]
MADNAVLADLVSFLTEKIDIITLEICTCLLPLLTGLLQSKLDRHQDISLNMLLKLVRVFGPLIYTSLSTPTSVGVDIEAEKRMERCNLCFIELEKVKNHLPALSRGGSIAKSAQELSLALQEVS